MLARDESISETTDSGCCSLSPLSLPNIEARLLSKYPFDFSQYFPGTADQELISAASGSSVEVAGLSSVPADCSVSPGDFRTESGSRDDLSSSDVEQLEQELRQLSALSELEELDCASSGPYGNFAPGKGVFRLWSVSSVRVTSLQRDRGREDTHKRLRNQLDRRHRNKPPSRMGELLDSVRHIGSNLGS